MILSKNRVPDKHATTGDNESNKSEKNSQKLNTVKARRFGINFSV